MIVLFTSNSNGGVVQLTVQLQKTICELGISVCAFVPKASKLTVDSDIKDFLVFYEKVNTINIMSASITAISRRVMDERPSSVWFLDNGVVSKEVSIRLGGRVSQVMIFHDAGMHHPSNNSSIMKKVRRAYEGRLDRIALRSIDTVVLLSGESKEKFVQNYPTHASKSQIIPLGAHMPSCQIVAPVEFGQGKEENYYLFFGRIDKYKGLHRLLEAYTADKLIKSRLVIAGNGMLTTDERRLCDSDERVILLNRYIDDGEMVYLFTNAKVLVLPYIEATQSGIIPIAYQLGKPVIVSDVKGLTQFVEPCRTGFVFTNNDELLRSLRAMEDDSCIDHMSQNCVEYYKQNLEWSNNILHFMRRNNL